MPLQAIHDTVDEIPEAFRELYSEKNGKFELTGITGVKTQADIDRLQTSLGKEREDHKTTKTSLGIWGDLNHEEVMGKLDRMPELEAAAKGKLDDAQIDEVVNRRVEGTLNSRLAPVEREKKTLAEENATLKEENATLRGEKTKRSIHDAVREQLIKTKAIGDAHEDALFLAERVFEVRADDGAVVTKEGVGVTPGVNADVWLGEMQEKRRHWWPDSVGSGAGGSNAGGSGGSLSGAANPWSLDGWNMTRQGSYLREHGRDRANQMAKAAGTTVGGGKPRPKK